MEPFIKTGSVVFVKTIDPKTIKKGDVIAFTSPSNPKDTILHRVDSIKSAEPLIFSTKGDANNSPDAWDVVDVGVKGVYTGAIPYLGYAGAFVKKPIGFAFVIGLPALLFIISQFLNIKKAINEEISRKVKEQIGHREKTETKINLPLKNIMIGFIAFSALISFSTINIIGAVFVDTVKVDGISLSVKDFVAPSIPQNLRWLNPNVSCGGYTNSYTITADWDNSTDNVGVVKYEYEITYPKIGGGVGVWNTFITLSSYPGVFNQAEGVHTYRIRSYDAENNVSAWSGSCSITHDKTLPDSEITYPFNSNGDNKIQYTYIWNGKVEGNSSDNFSGIDHVELSIYRSLLDLYWNGSNWVHGSETGTRVIAVGTTSWEYQYLPIFLRLGVSKLSPMLLIRLVISKIPPLLNLKTQCPKLPSRQHPLLFHQKLSPPPPLPFRQFPSIFLQANTTTKSILKSSIFLRP